MSALMVMVCGAEDAEAMAFWAESHSDWLAEFLDMPHGAPSQDIYLRVFAALHPEAFQQVFQHWVVLLRARLKCPQGHIAVNGKSSRATRDVATGAMGVHTVTAWLVEERLVLGQAHVAQKSNEIQVILEIRALLDLRGATVTMDAMGCQREVESQSPGAGGHYVLAVKKDQPGLAEEIQRAFADAFDPHPRPKDQRPLLKVETHRETDKGHGRREVRRLDVCRDLSFVTTSSRWVGLALIAQVTRERTVLATGKTEQEVCYFIGSVPKGPVPPRLRRRFVPIGRLRTNATGCWTWPLATTGPASGPGMRARIFRFCAMLR